MHPHPSDRSVSARVICLSYAGVKVKLRITIKFVFVLKKNAKCEIRTADFPRDGHLEKRSWRSRPLDHPGPHANGIFYFVSVENKNLRIQNRRLPCQYLNKSTLFYYQIDQKCKKTGSFNLYRLKELLCGFIKQLRQILNFYL